MGSHKTKDFNFLFSSIKLIVKRYASIEPLSPSGDIKLRSSNEVWYSSYVPYFDLMIEAIGKSTLATKLSFVTSPIKPSILFKGFIN